MQDGLIAQTGNQCESYYRQTDPGAIKHKCKARPQDISISCQEDGVLDHEVRSDTPAPCNVTASPLRKTLKVVLNI